ncbi:cobyrinic acid a,c-diamide synthase [Piscirickettsia litoralis]|uniref:Cobyrinic acid a,c-diamide synthase n=1 Tax=Piscirickettsia litoralis TaxID=1891921 RepID=A0ABX3A5S5_9GAMM|nr:MinD/ParA family protein [Piscirickettsia litoralis]ODN43989.1 cobyrinic acid a,c-diamide synthase [Piscirickettsia litoralis]
MHDPKSTQVIAITGGKGGVGKTNISVNLSIALARQGQSVMLLDADLGLANVDVLLGIHPEYNIADVLKGNCALDDIIVEGPAGVKIIPSASGLQKMSELSTREHATLIQAFNHLTVSLDTLIVDTAAGISDAVVSFSRASHEVVVVVCDEPTSITDAYALIKLLSTEYDMRRFRILANMVKNSQQGEQLFEKMIAVTDRFLDVMLQYVGALPFDPYIRRAVQKQKAVVEVYPRSEAAVALTTLAQQIQQWQTPNVANGQTEFFVERLIRQHSMGGAIA